MNSTSADRRIFIVVGEHSGDILGAKLIAALRETGKFNLSFAGVGGEHMTDEGFLSLFPLSEVAVMGPTDILKALPGIVRCVYRCVNAAIAFQPDLVVIIDSPEFSHPIARRIRKRRPDIPIIDYVSPSVWGWRPGRAKKMRRYVDHVLALLPFEVEAHKRLGGPLCTYVGHPLVEQLDLIESSAADVTDLCDRLQIDRQAKLLVVLPGSRPNEVNRLMQPFGETVRRLKSQYQNLEVIIPAVASVRHLIEVQLSDWPLIPHFVSGDTDKYASFRVADAALAASGTVTLELALAQLPMVVGYRLDIIAANLTWLSHARSMVLPNLILDENAIPEFLHKDCTPENLAEAVSPLLADTPERFSQAEALSEVKARVSTSNKAPSRIAAGVVCHYLKANQSTQH